MLKVAAVAAAFISTRIELSFAPYENIATAW